MAKIPRRVKEIISSLPPECPTCANAHGQPLCSMCVGVKELRLALNMDVPSVFDGSYDEYNRWRRRKK